ncbi:MAG: OsmC family protein [Chloroflexi bacterium]|nr:OsmC family protein [Chloroflexota bacterium]
MSEENLSAPDDLQTPYICEGGNLDCGSGLLLLIRDAMNQVPQDQVLEIRSTEVSVREDLPAWCRMTQNPYLGWQKGEGHLKFFVRRGDADQKSDEAYQQARNYRWQTRTHWNGGMATTVYCRNHSWHVGQPASFDVKDDAPSAVEYVLGALGACLAMGLQIRASQRKIEIDEIEISLSGQIDNIFVFLGTELNGHSGFKEITGTLYAKSTAAEEILQELWSETLAASPVMNTLTHNATINIGLRVV